MPPNVNLKAINSAMHTVLTSASIHITTVLRVDFAVTTAGFLW